GGDDLTITGPGTFSFATGVVNGATYAVTIKAQADLQVCSLGSGAGTAGSSDINATLTCGPLRFMAVKIGDGVTPLSASSTAASVEEWVVGGSPTTPVRTLSLPTAVTGSNNPLTLAGNAASEGALSLSVNKK